MKHFLPGWKNKKIIGIDIRKDDFIFVCVENDFNSGEIIDVATIEISGVS